MIHPSFGISAIYCAEQYAKVRNWICLLLLMLKPLVEISTSKLTHIYVIGKMGQSTRSEDISLACSQGLELMMIMKLHRKTFQQLVLVLIILLLIYMDTNGDGPVHAIKKLSIISMLMCRF